MKIEWTYLAKTDYWQNIEYLEEKWTELDVLNFIAKVEKAISLLKSETALFVNSGYENVFKMVITKHITLYYSVNSDTTYLLRFWNNQQDLNTLKLK